MNKDSKPLVGCDHIETGVSSPCSELEHVDDNTKMSVQAEELQYTDHEAKGVKRKIDLVVLPLLCGCYIFSVSLRNERSIQRMNVDL